MIVQARVQADPYKSKSNLLLTIVIYYIGVRNYCVSIEWIECIYWFELFMDYPTKSTTLEFNKK